MDVETICEFESYRDARGFFRAARSAALAIPGLNARLADGVDGIERTRGSGGRQKNATGDPTASAAIFLAERAAEELSRLRAALEERESLVGHALVVVEHVRAELGSKYADALDARYIDAMKWEDAAEALGCSDRTAQTRCDVALDWLDAGGLRSAPVAA